MDAKIEPHDVEASELSEADFDAFIARNRDALNASIEQARAELAEGRVSTLAMEEIIALCTART